MPEQRDEAWVKSASAEAIANAVDAGELVRYLGGRTAEELAHDAHVNQTPDRLRAEAYGFGSHSLLTSAVNAYGTSALEVKRRSMSSAQLEKLDWLESASPSEAFAAEQAGELDNLLGRDVKNEATRLAAIRNDVDQSLRAALAGGASW